MGRKIGVSTPPNGKERRYFIEFVSHLYGGVPDEKHRDRFHPPFRQHLQAGYHTVSKSLRYKYFRPLEGRAFGPPSAPFQPLPPRFEDLRYKWVAPNVYCFLPAQRFGVPLRPRVPSPRTLLFSACGLARWTAAEQMARRGPRQIRHGSRPRCRHYIHRDCLRPQNCAGRVR